MNLRTKMDANLTEVNFLVINMNLSTGNVKPYHKPNSDTFYIDIGSKHPPSTINQLVNNISRRISNLSADKASFKKATPTTTSL